MRGADAKRRQRVLGRELAGAAVRDPARVGQGAAWRERVRRQAPTRAESRRRTSAGAPARHCDADDVADLRVRQRRVDAHREQRRRRAWP